RYGSLLICDEVMTGFRVAYRGAQSRFGMDPDLTTFGKIIGGGLPVGAYAGRAELMNHILPAGNVFQAGTLSGNPLACAAGIATLDVLRRQNPYPQLESRSQRLAEGIAQAASRAGQPLCVQRVGSMMTFFFQTGPIVDWTTSAQSDTHRYARFFWEMLDRGIYLPCSQFEAMFVSTAHSDADIDRTLTAARESFAAIAQ
ncbi:MAG: aminotransferase class III-fold pyridoxal phosphate-dependent enzyme, partial [Thermoguttaceae bacterium]|nr:aminotransferase class III-fold pyridoxal phosphate-dependent enzyme [Thermoguttaceae bacterium]